ncbi:hypothetical protein E2562_031763 [Oryza meyeriana var. granulata]|uniref:Gibberellin regulated protein n=1 Tax=Oryza meyeriana var. granulata TaxID=110450 RepID=A0A6G1CVB9_9ORYZ|nr:hypothetical protein E2562_031763 [Oryza meyeriana var. granulata]
MASSKIPFLVIIAVVLLLAIALPAPWECSPKCAGRCSDTQYKKACLTFCNKCCAKCLCVPPGTYGNKGACPCYNNWKTKEGGPKCP